MQRVSTPVLTLKLWKVQEPQKILLLDSWIWTNTNLTLSSNLTNLTIQALSHTLNITFRNITLGGGVELRLNGISTGMKYQTLFLEIR